MPVYSSDDFEEPFLLAPPPSPESRAPQSPLLGTVLQGFVGQQTDPFFFTKINALATGHYLSLDQVFLLHTAGIQISGQHINHIMQLLFFMVSKNLHALALGNYSAKALELNIYTNIDLCLEFYVSHKLISQDKKLEFSSRLHALHPLTIKDFIPGFFCIVDNWLSGEAYDVDKVIGTLIAQLEETNEADAYYPPTSGTQAAEAIAYHSNNLATASRGMLIHCVDTLVLHDFLHPSDGMRLRFIMNISNPSLLIPLILEAFALSSKQCEGISHGYRIIPSLPWTLSESVHLHCQRQEICPQLCTTTIAAIKASETQGRLLEIEREFYTQLLAILSTK